jgi:hypothetical protein
MQFGPEINNGWRTSVCPRCLSAFVADKRSVVLKSGGVARGELEGAFLPKFKARNAAKNVKMPT